MTVSTQRAAAVKKKKAGTLSVIRKRAGNKMADMITPLHEGCQALPSCGGGGGPLPSGSSARVHCDVITGSAIIFNILTFLILLNKSLRIHKNEFLGGKQSFTNTTQQEKNLSQND